MKSENNKNNFLSFHASSIFKLVKEMNLNKKSILYFLPIYYLVTIINAFIASVLVLIVVSVFTGNSTSIDNSLFTSFIFFFLFNFGGSNKFPDIAYFLIVLVGAYLFFRLSLLVCDGIIFAKLRRRLQERIFTQILNGKWSYMRDFRVGNAVGTNTQEAINVSKYLTSAISALYFLLSSLVMIIMALITSVQATLLLAVCTIPFVFLIKKIFLIQSNLSKELAMLRNKFSADITDRLNGLLQINVENNNDYHIEQGVISQKRLTRVEILIGYCQAILGSFKPLLGFFALSGLIIWLLFLGDNSLPNLTLLASVGALGMSGATQLNAALAALGNLSRLSGSLFPVISALKTPSSHSTKLINERVVGLNCSDLRYSYGSKNVIDGVTFSASKGIPLILSGRSGKGKTTISNIIAGLYLPEHGNVKYIGVSGQEYPSEQYRAKIGFVTQDIYLFSGSLRSNLVSDKIYSDDEIWHILDQVDASEFVRNLGGLDVDTAEAGRSLSGGQKRRLGIARVLISGSDILIFDEVTSGLDKNNTKAVTLLINKLSKDRVIVIISHEDFELEIKSEYKI